MLDSPVVWGLSLVGLAGLLLLSGWALRPSWVSHRWFGPGWVASVVVLAVLVVAVVTVIDGPVQGATLFAEYLQESAFAVDTVLVFAVVLQRVLPDGDHATASLHGVAGTILLRIGFILTVGSVVQQYAWTLLVIAPAVLYGAIRIGGKRRHQPDVRPRGSTAERWAKRVGGRYLPPMLFATAVLTLADPVAWPDGSSQLFLLIVANALALLPVPALLRYADRIVAVIAYMPAGIAMVAGFVGVKIFLQGLSANVLPFINGGNHVGWAPVIGPALSLAVTVGTVTIAVVASWAGFKRSKAAAQPMTDPPKAVEPQTIVEPPTSASLLSAPAAPPVEPVPGYGTGQVRWLETAKVAMVLLYVIGGLSTRTGRLPRESWPVARRRRHKVVLERRLSRRTTTHLYRR